MNVTEPSEPKNRLSVSKIMTGKLIPLYINSDKPNATMSVMLPENGLLTLTLDILSNMTSYNKLLFRNRWSQVFLID
jgi:hypothetical protein